MLPLPLRELMALNRHERPPAVGRQAIFLGAAEPRAARPRKSRRGATPSRPRPVSGVNELVKYADIDRADAPRKNFRHDIVRITGGMLRAARSLTGLSQQEVADRA